MYHFIHRLYRQHLCSIYFAREAMLLHIICNAPRQPQFVVKFGARIFCQRRPTDYRSKLVWELLVQRNNLCGKRNIFYSYAACCMNQDIHNLVTQTSNDKRKTILSKIYTETDNGTWSGHLTEVFKFTYGA